MRSDIIYKVILRKIRKQYITEFNNLTSYIKSWRFKKSNFLIECLDRYVDTLQGVDEPLKQDLVFLLGSMFYPKHMKEIYRSPVH